MIIGWGDMAKPAHRFMAFDKATGEMLWFNGTRPLPEDTTYSTPVVAAAQRAGGDGVWLGRRRRLGLSAAHRQADLGFQLSRRGLNVSPVVDGDKVYMAHAEENPDNPTHGRHRRHRRPRHGRHHQDGRVVAAPRAWTAKARRC